MCSVCVSVSEKVLYDQFYILGVFRCGVGVAVGVPTVDLVHAFGNDRFCGDIWVQF